MIMKKSSLEQFYNGMSLTAYEYFGAHCIEKGGQKGVMFRTYAPHARDISVIGEFNEWQGTKMKRVDAKGVYEVFIPHAKRGQMYKLRVHQATGRIVDKADPYAFYSELRPNTASIIEEVHRNLFTDDEWMKNRTKNFDQPVSIYEVHIGSWKKPDEDNVWYTYDEIGDDLIKYAKKVGYTHLELMPLNEYPFDGSWGYQCSGYFSATSRYGTVEQLMRFINKCHRHNLGVIIDFVPVHFVKDDYTLGYFDGTPLYEYEKGEDANSQWGTSNFNLSREEVRSFLMSAANFWLEVYHVDGLRMDAISNIIYWHGNKDKGENKGALDFIKRLNYHLSEKHPTCMLIAEDSSDFPKVTKPTVDGGLGFDYKWDLGWMHDTLKYFELDPIYRQYHHNQMTFSMAYFYSEKFMMPFSHDEVVHGKHTIIDKIWGTYEQKFAQCRALYTYMFTHPGKKLNFMGNEIAQFREWDENRENDWFLLDYPIHDAFLKFFTDLHKLMRKYPAMYELDYQGEGFRWIDADNKSQNVFVYTRRNKDQKFLVVLNLSPNHYDNFCIGLENKGSIKEILNSDQDIYGGSGIVNPKAIRTHNEPYNFLPYSVRIDLAPFAGAVFEIKESAVKSEKAKAVGTKAAK